jgi:hypothetical protein
VNLNSIVKLSSNQVSCDLDSEAAILHLQTGVYYGLDPVGAVIWKLMEEPRTVASIRDAILEQYAVDAERCGRDLLELLQRLATEGLIEIQ